MFNAVNRFSFDGIIYSFWEFSQINAGQLQKYLKLYLIIAELHLDA